MEEQRSGIKFLFHDKKHNGVDYNPGGLIVDPLEWYPHGLCQPGGLYFTTTEHAHHWMHFDYGWVADVVVPDGQPVYADGTLVTTKWKAPQLQLTRVRTVSEWVLSLSDAELRTFMYNLHPCLFEYVLKNYDVAMRWVKLYPQSIAFLDPTRHRGIWVELVKLDPGNLKYIPESYHVLVKKP